MFTLGDAGGSVARRDANVIVWTAGCAGTMIGSAGLAMAVSKILERSTMTWCWASPNWENGGCRLWVGEGLCQGSRCDDGCIDG